MATNSKAAIPRGGPKEKPNQTLYIKNLNDRLQKTDLKRSLYILCATYGPVLDIVTLKTPKMRGQAHVVFRDIHVASNALRALQGFEFFGKEMQISYAKGKSDTIAKLDGTFKIPVMETSTTTTDLQKSVFGGLLPGEEDSQSNQGQKRARGDNGSDGGDAPMDEDDEDAEMEIEESDSD